MKNNELYELLKYINPKSILIIDYKNKLRKLDCPFKVEVLYDIGILVKGHFEFVTEVKITIEIKTVYIINKQAYYSFHFEIII